MATEVLLGLDLGTGSVKAVLVDPEGGERGFGRAGYGLVQDETGSAEIDVDVWWAAVRAAVEQALRSAHGPVTVVAIGLSGQMHGVVALDSDGRPVRPAITWADRRGLAVLADVNERAAPLLSTLVNPPAPGFAATTLAWLIAREPATMARVAVALAPKDWLGHRLTGLAGTEATDASATGLWDFDRGGWSAGFTRSLGINVDVLPTVHGGLETRGSLTRSVAAELGLPAGIPVAYGRADVAAALMGLGIDLAGVTTLTMGTGAQLCQVLRDRPSPPRPGLLALAGPADGEHYLMAGVFSAGLALDWVRRLWSLSWADLLNTGLSAATARPPVFVPFVAGERMVRADADLAGSWIDVRAEHGRADLLRAAIIGTLHTVRWARDLLRSDPQSDAIETCVAVGGGMGDPRLRRLLADVLGVVVGNPGLTNASARGAALTAAVAAGWCPPTEIGAMFRCDLTTVAPDPGDARAQDDEYARFASLVTTLAERSARVA